jgi:hypothetical protein
MISLVFTIGSPSASAEASVMTGLTVFSAGLVSTIGAGLACACEVPNSDAKNPFFFGAEASALGVSPAGS